MNQPQVPAQLEGVQYRLGVIEHVDPEERTLLMRAAPYNHEVQLTRGLWEQFAPGTFKRAAQAAHRVKFFLGHGDEPAIGHALEVEDRPDGCWIRMKFSNTARAQDARELAMDGTLDQVSVEFLPEKDWMDKTHKPDGLHVRHRQAFLRGVALVAHGAYADQAFVASVRSDDQMERARELRRAQILAWTH